MADNRDDLNFIAAAPGGRSKRPGDVPEAVRLGYYFDNRAGVLGFYADATVQQPAFRDRGDRLTAARTDPDAIGHMTAIARHRGWAIITVRGETSFRREAWLSARLLDLEVLGYHPTERDLQALERRRTAQIPHEHPSAASAEHAVQARTHQRERDLSQRGPRSRLKVAETVIRSRVFDRAAQDRMLAAARDRLAGWLDRGARFEALNVGDRQITRRERQR
jgi:Large polyvalent protein-associated domain 7